MPKTTKVKKKVSKPKTKVASKPKKTKASPAKKVPIKISKTYVPKETEKYMCEKHKVCFRMKLQEWKKELVKANNEALYNGSMDDNSISADIVDQASSYTDKNVEMKAINRQIKLISEIDKALEVLSEGNCDQVITLASLAMNVRGYEDIKIRRAKEFMADLPELSNQIHS